MPTRRFFLSALTRLLLWWRYRALQIGPGGRCLFSRGFTVSVFFFTWMDWRFFHFCFTAVMSRSHVTVSCPTSAQRYMWYIPISGNSFIFKQTETLNTRAHPLTTMSVVGLVSGCGNVILYLVHDKSFLHIFGWCWTNAAAAAPFFSPCWRWPRQLTNKR